MTIEQSIDRLSAAIENLAQSTPRQLELDLTTNEPVPDVESAPVQETHAEPEPAQDDTRPWEMSDVVAALEQFLPDRRQEAFEILQSFGVSKVGQVTPEMFDELINQLNAKFHS
jgi:hypothetical protein